MALPNLYPAAVVPYFRKGGDYRYLREGGEDSRN